MTSLNRLQKPVLVLNASYEPINICAARRALVLVLKGVASAEEESTQHIHSARSAVKLPSVIRLLEYRRIPHQTRALVAQEHSDAGPLHVPVLPPHAAVGRVDAGPCGAAVARGRIQLGEPGGVLQSLQQPEGQPHAGRIRDEAGAAAAAFQFAHQPAFDAAAGQERRAVAEVFVLLTNERAAYEAAAGCEPAPRSCYPNRLGPRCATAPGID
jgi:hypothetical protein